MSVRPKCIGSSLFRPRYVSFLHSTAAVSGEPRLQISAENMRAALGRMLFVAFSKHPLRWLEFQRVAYCPVSHYRDRLKVAGHAIYAAADTVAAFVHICEVWPAPGSEDTELGVLMELEVGHGETEVYPRVQA